MEGRIIAVKMIINATVRRSMSMMYPSSLPLRPLRICGWSLIKRNVLASLQLSLGQRNTLWRPAVNHVLHLDAVAVDVNHLIAAIHNFALARHPHILALGKEYLLGLARLAGKPEKLQWNRGWGRWWRRSIDGHRIVRIRGSHWLLNLYRVRLRHENISSSPFVLRLLGRGQKVQPQRGIEIFRALFLRCLTAARRRRNPGGQGSRGLRTRIRRGRRSEHQRQELVSHGQHSQSAQHRGPDRLLLAFQS